MNKTMPKMKKVKMPAMKKMTSNMAKGMMKSKMPKASKISLKMKSKRKTYGY